MLYRRYRTTLQRVGVLGPERLLRRLRRFRRQEEADLLMDRVGAPQRGVVIPLPLQDTAVFLRMQLPGIRSQRVTPEVVTHRYRGNRHPKGPPLSVLVARHGLQIGTDHRQSSLLEFDVLLQSPRKGIAHYVQ